MSPLAKLVLAGVVTSVATLAAIYAWRVQRSAALVKAANAAQSFPQASSVSLLVVGDSTGVGVGAGSSSNSVAGRIAIQFPATQVANAAQSGAKSRDIAGQIDAAQSRVDVVLIQVGGNDVMSFRSVERIAGDLRPAIKSARLGAPTVILMPAGNVGTAPFFSWPLSDLVSRRARDIHAMQRRIAAEEGAVFVDLFEEEGSDPFAAQPAVYYARDGLHPSGAGYGLWFAELMRQAGLARHLRAT